MWPWPRTWCFEFTPPGGLGHVSGALNSLHLVALATYKFMYFVAAASFSFSFLSLLRGQCHVPGVLNSFLGPRTWCLEFTPPGGLGHVQIYVLRCRCIIFFQLFVSLTWPWPRTWCLEFTPPGGLGHVQIYVLRCRYIVFPLTFCRSDSTWPWPCTNLC